MQAIILAGGFGTRLKSMVDQVPKPMAPLSGRPFLCWLLEYLESQGVSEAVLCLHHLPEIVRGHFGERYGRMKLHYSLEDKPLGTGGAIRQAMQYLNPTEPVFALNGDSLVEINYAQMLRRHRASNRPITIATRRVNDCRRYSQLQVQHGIIGHYELYGEQQPGDISTGVYVLSPNLFDNWITPLTSAPAGGFGEGAFSLERDFLAPLAASIKPAAYDDVGYFIDIGVPEDYTRAQLEIPALLEKARAA